MLPSLPSSNNSSSTTTKTKAKAKDFPQTSLTARGDLQQATAPPVVVVESKKINSGVLFLSKEGAGGGTLNSSKNSNSLRKFRKAPRNSTSLSKLGRSLISHSNSVSKLNVISTVKSQHSSGSVLSSLSSDSNKSTMNNSNGPNNVNSVNNANEALANHHWNSPQSSRNSSSRFKYRDNFNKSSSRNNKWNNYLIKVTLKTHINLHTLQCMNWRRKGFYYISVTLDKDCVSNYIESSVFEDPQQSDANDQSFEVNKVTSTIFEISEKNETVILHKKLNIVSELLYEINEFNNAINRDVPIAINVNLHGSPDNCAKKYMQRYASCKLRLSTLSYEYCSYNEFIHFPVSYPSVLNITTHSCITKIVPVVYHQSTTDMIEYRELNEPPVAYNHNWSSVFISIIEALIFSLNCIINSYDTYAIAFSQSGSEAGKTEKLRKYIECSLENEDRKDFFLSKHGQGPIDIIELFRVIGHLQDSILGIWTNYLIEIDSFPQIVYYIGVNSSEHRLNCDMFTNLLASTNLHSDLLRYQDFKNPIKRLKNSAFFDNLMWNPIHQLSSDHIAMTEQPNGQTCEKNLSGNVTYFLNQPAQLSIIMEESCSFQKHEDINVFNSKSILPKHKHYEIHHKLSNINLNSCSSNQQIIDNFSNFSLGQQTLNSLNTISKPFDDNAAVNVANHRNFRIPDKSFFAGLYNHYNGIKYDRGLNLCCHSNFYLNYHKKNRLKTIYAAKFQIIMQCLNDLGYGNLSKRPDESSSYPNPLYRSLNSMNNYQNASTLSQSMKFVKEPTDCHLTKHCVIYIPGLQGTYLDLLNYKNIIENSAENILSIMPKQNRIHNSPISDQAECILDEIMKQIGPLSQIGKISFVSYSLGCIITRALIELDRFKIYLPKLHTFLSISGPHLGIAYHSNLYSIGSWFIKKLTKSQSMEELSLSDHEKAEGKFLYKLSNPKNLNKFKNLILISSQQDQIVPSHSARIEMCKGAYSKSTTGLVYQNMIRNIFEKLSSSEINIVRYEIFFSEFDLQNHSSFLMKGKAAHLAVLDFRFVQRLIRSHLLQYF